MQTLEATYEIVTPMFMGGAESQDEPEIRPPSIKGALRFWWRALQWGACLSQSPGDTGMALKTLYEQEARLFGAATVEERYGQGLCHVKLSQDHTQGSEKNWPRNNDAGAGFLGYGLDATQNGAPHRQAIAKGSFTVTLVLKSTINDIEKQQLQDTLLLFGLLGGLGSRSRRGFGSIAIRRMNDQDITLDSIQAYDQLLKTLIDRIQLAPGMPIFTALNADMVIARAGLGADPRRLMDRLGGQYREARKQAGKGMAKAPFGLPLAGNRGNSDEKNRRSSPLLMHIHPIGNQFVAMATLIPAQFHPAHLPAPAFACPARLA